MQKEDYESKEFWDIYLRIKKFHPKYTKQKLMLTARYAYDKKYRIGKYSQCK